MPQGKPWEKYGATPAGPWEKYGGATARTPDPGVEAAPTLDQRMVQGARDFMGRAAPFTVDPIVGAAKGVGSTAFSIQQLINRGLGRDVQEKPDLLKPQTTGESVGYGAEQIGEFFLPGMVATRAPRLAGTAARTAVEMAGSAAITGVQTEGDIGQAFTSAALAGAVPAVVRGLGKMTTATGQKIQQTVIRPTQADIQAGFKIASLQKYGITGSLDEMGQATVTKIRDLASQLKNELQGSTVTIDVGQILTDVQADLIKNRATTFGLNNKIKAALDSMLDELATVAPTGKVSVTEAQEIKRATGLLGSWLYGARDLDANATEKVANTLYTKLRQAIEAAVPGGKIADLNRQMSELIPIEQAIIRRIPVADRNNILSLTDVVGLTGSVFNPAALSLVIANKASKSGRVGGALVGAGRNMTGTIAGPVVAGGATQLNRPRD